MPHMSPQPVTPATMRHTLAGFATGLSVVAAELDGRIIGMPANSLSSVSLDPPLVSLAFAHTSTTWPVLRNASRWGISILGEEQGALFNALRRPADERFHGIDVSVEDGPVHILNALATMTVIPRTVVKAGDHELVLLDVITLRRDETRRPLVFFDSTTHLLAQ